MKKGFTLVELIAVISIISLLLLIGVPSYLLVSNNIKQTMYESKVKELLSKGEEYAEETNVFVFSVNTLLEEGKISADNETGNLLDPRDKRKMNCDIIEVHYENNNYDGNYIESNTCLSAEELNNQYGMVNIIVKNGEAKVIDNPSEWHISKKDTLSYEFKEDYQGFADKVKSILWTGEEEKSCSIENKVECEKYEVTASATKMVTIYLKLVLERDGTEVTQSYSKVIAIDNEKPGLVDGSIIYDNESYGTDARKVTFELTDYNGSGVASYGLVTEKECKNVNYKEANDGVQTEYLTNGTYYICAKDKAGNEVGYFEAKDEIYIDKVDNNSLNINITNSANNDWTKNDITLTIKTNKTDIDFCMYKYDNEEYQRYNGTIQNKTISYGPITTSQNRKFYFVCYDKAGNRSNEATTNIKIDKENPNVSFTETNKTAGENGWYKALSIKMDVKDTLSGLSNFKYCVTNSNCTPNINVTGSTKTVSLSNGKNNKVCVSATDKVGNNVTKCSNTYNVDNVIPTTSMTATCNGSSIIVKATNYKDNLSGVHIFYFNNGSGWVSSTKDSYTYAVKSGNFKVKVKDWAGNVSKEVNASQTCAPKLTRVGDALMGTLSPLNSSQIVQFTYRVNWASRDEYKQDEANLCDNSSNSYNCSKSTLNGRVININGTTINYGTTQRLRYGKYALGVDEHEAVRISDSKVAFTGTSNSLNNGSALRGVVIYNISGNTFSEALGHVLYQDGSNHNWIGVEGMSYTPGSSTLTVYMDCGNSSYYRNCIYYININNGSFTKTESEFRSNWQVYNAGYDKEGRVGSTGIPKYKEYQDYIGLNNGTPISLCNASNYDNVPIAAGVYEGNSCYGRNAKKIISGDDWASYGSSLSIGHMGNDKLVLHVGGRTKVNGSYTYKSYFMFYRKVNGTWKYQYTMEAPGNNTSSYDGEFISLNADTLVYNSKNNGFYIIQY